MEANMQGNMEKDRQRCLGAEGRNRSWLALLQREAFSARR